MKASATTALAALLALAPGIMLHGAAAASGPGTSVDIMAAKAAEQALIDVIAKATPAFVFIGGGSGVLISADGVMLTNHHVAGSSQNWNVRVAGKRYHAQVLGHDARGDITLLKLKDAKGLPYVELADSDKMQVGQRVIAIGNPFGTAEDMGDPTVTEGIVSALHRFQGNYTDAIQTDAPINPGNSGGPLLTLDGRLAGINGQIRTKHGERSNTGIGYAIPANQIKRFLPKLEGAGGRHVFHGFIRGIAADQDEKDGLRNGAEITEVAAGSWAEKQGFKAGDRVVEVAGYPVHSVSRFFGVIGTFPADAELPVTLVRGGAKQALSIALEPLAPSTLAFTVKQPKTPDVSKIKDARQLVQLRNRFIKELQQQKPVVDAALPKATTTLKPGDTVVAIEGQPIANLLDFHRARRALRASKIAGDVIAITVRRGEQGGGAEVELKEVLASAYEHADVDEDG